MEVIRDASRPSIDWLGCRYVAIDVEGTASPAGQPEGLVEVAAVELTETGGETRVFHSLVNPGQPISSIGTRIHGLRDRDVAQQPTMADISSRLAELVDDGVVVAHNARVDWSLVHRDCPALRPLAVLDTLRMSRALWPEVRKHGLDSVLERLDVEVKDGEGVTRGGRHTALHDALATARVFRKMVLTAEQRGLALPELLERCRLNVAERPRPDVPQMDLFEGQ
jgi:DNA polymerase III epsilon subunit-like protein